MIQKLLIVSMLICFQTTLFSKNQIAINFDDLKLRDFIHIVSKVIGKNILIVPQISGNVDYIYTKPIYEDDVLPILQVILKSKGLKLEQNNGVLSVIQNNVVKKSTEVFYLKNSKSQAVVKIIRNIISKNSSENILVSSNDESNSIILVGEEQEIKYLSKLIKKLDIHKGQVYVQAKIIEISELRTNNIGLQYGLNGLNKYGAGLFTFSSALNANAAVNAVPNTSLNTYGYNLQNLRSNLSLGAAINLLRQNKALEVISEPSILCINNKASTIYVGETRSIKTGTTTTSGGTVSDQYIRENIGLKLKVKPRISSHDKVTLQIEAIIEDITGGVSTEPNTIKKEVLTTAIANNGESVIIGGLIKSKNELIKDKVAFFGDIPILGELFRNNYDVQDKINLVIIVTPYIVPKSKDLTFVRDQLVELRRIENRYTQDIINSLQKKKIKQNEVKSTQEKTNQQLHKERVKAILAL
jgi:general secretion pathway protein D